MSRIHFRRFFALNVIGAAVWATAIGVLAYFFGHALEILLGDLKRYERAAMIAVAIAGTLVWAAHFCRQRRCQPEEPQG